MATSSIDYNPTLIYHEGDYCKWPTDGTVDGYLWRCKTTTTGVFDEECWIQLGLVIDQTGYLKSDEGDITYADEVYMKEEGGIFEGEVSYNINGATSDSRKPFRFLKGSSENGDMCVFQGGYGSTVLSSGNLVANTSIFADSKFNITPEAKDLAVISYGEVNVFTNALSTQSAIKALTLDKTGKLLVKAKDTDVVNSTTEVATEAQVLKVKTELNNKITTNDSKVVHLEGGEVINGFKTFNTAPRLRNNLTPSTNTSKTNSIEDGLLQTSINSNGIIDGASIIRFQKTDGSREVRYRAGFRRIPESTEEGVNNNLWPTVSVGVSPSNATYGRFDTNLAYAPNPENSTSTSDQRIVTVGWANTPNSNNLVHKTGTEEIGGSKRFTDNIARKNLNITRGSSPSSDQYFDIYFTDKDNKWLGGLEQNVKTNKTNSLSVIISDTVNGSTNVQGCITLTENADTTTTTTLNTTYAYGPTQSLSASGTELITGNWIREAMHQWFNHGWHIRACDCIFQGPIGSGTINLTAPYDNYTFLMVDGGDDNQNNRTVRFVPVWVINQERAHGRNWALWGSVSGQYWYGAASSTTTSIISGGENSVITAIYGIKI